MILILLNSHVGMTQYCRTEFNDFCVDTDEVSPFINCTGYNLHACLLNPMRQRSSTGS